jgi:hypothetical protein
MAKYLGGIEDPNIEITGISQHFFSSGFDIQYYNYQIDTLSVQKMDIAKSLVKYEEVSAEIYSSPNRSAGALVGYLAGGPVWGIIGAALSGSPAYEKHVVLCELENDWRFAMELDKNEYRAWKEAMDKKLS